MRIEITLALFFAAILAAGNAPADDMELTVKPVLCITDNRNPSCDMSFLVLWQSATTGYYCLFNDFDDQPLRCWRQERTAELTDDRSVHESFSFWMTADDFEARLAQVDIEVLRLDSDDRRRKRRTRHVWDIN
jgi:hypothetical protein